MVLGVISPAFAADPVVVYKSGILASVFVGVFALIVVALLVPALFMLVGLIEVLVESVRQRMVVSSHTPWMTGVHQGPVATEKKFQWPNLHRIGINYGKKDF